MELTYDRKHNIAYIRFRPIAGGSGSSGSSGGSDQVQTLRISEEMNVDIAPDGTVYGIELLNANEQLEQDDAGRLTVRDMVSGRAGITDKIAKQMGPRGWTEPQIAEALKSGQQIPAINKA
ncbi:MAG: DUF2283 domain-containing protein, partial [Phycisphaeraceae bacterium]